MTDSRIYIDTAPFIYYLEKNFQYFDLIKKFFLECFSKHIRLVTSAITIEEYCVYPFSINDETLVDAFMTFINGMKIEVIPVETNIALEAARIRAKYKFFKALDSIHLATSKLSGCTLFLTNDNQLKQIQEQKVIAMEDLK